MDRNNPPMKPFKIGKVALRKESVDRNRLFLTSVFRSPLSLSARRAWIEIVESGELVKQFDGRSPQGERG